MAADRSEVVQINSRANKGTIVENAKDHPDYPDFCERVYLLRVQGKTLKKISELVGMGADAIYDAFKWYYANAPQGGEISPANRRRLSVDRMNTLYAALEEKALDGDVDAIKVCIKLEERVSMLCGLNAAQKLDVEQKTTRYVIEGMDPGDLT